MASEARRFTWLIDVLYDHRVKLLVSAECQAYDLYVEGRQASFEVTASSVQNPFRLRELVEFRCPSGL